MDNLTVEQIANLRREAINGGDIMLVCICDLSLHGAVRMSPCLNRTESARLAAMTQEEARMEIVRVLNEVVRY